VTWPSPVLSWFKHVRRAGDIQYPIRRPSLAAVSYSGAGTRRLAQTRRTTDRVRDRRVGPRFHIHGGPAHHLTCLVNIRGQVLRGICRVRRHRPDKPMRPAPTALSGHRPGPRSAAGLQADGMRDLSSRPAVRGRRRSCRPRVPHVEAATRPCRGSSAKRTQPVPDPTVSTWAMGIRRSRASRCSPGCGGAR